MYNSWKFFLVHLMNYVHVQFTSIKATYKPGPIPIHALFVFSEGILEVRSEKKRYVIDYQYMKLQYKKKRCLKKQERKSVM